MKYLKIQNDGELDIRLVALMGGTTKATDEYKIGQFGTGLKYTLAFLYRNNLDFKIFVGNEQVKLHTEKEVIRNEEFEIICINGQRTSITTRMGEDWQAWMIIRELWCNALDEGGAIKDIVEQPMGEENKTIFFIQVDKQIQDVLTQWDKYFIHDIEPIYKDDTYALYPPGEDLCIYKQGVLIHESKSLKSVFRYDIANAQINELREFKDSLSWAITMALYRCNEKAAQYFLETVNEDYYEGSDNMDFEWYTPNWGEAWKAVIGEAKIIYKKAVDDAAAMGVEIDTVKNFVVPHSVYKALTKQFPGIGALRVAGKAAQFMEHYDPIIENKVKQALVILESCDYPVHPDLEFVYGFFEDKRVLGMVSLDQKKVFISNTLMQRPLFDIITTVVEENEHFNTGMNDNTREFQQHFIDLYTRSLLKEHEVEI